MKTLIFVPTYRPGGIDVTLASLERQTYQDFDVFVSDSFHINRSSLWTGLKKIKGSMYVTNGPAKKDGCVRNLAASYNDAARYAVKHGYELFISLQDYIWAPEDGVERFVEISKKCPDDLITGLTSISADPGVGYVKDCLSCSHLYSIFKKPYSDKPQKIDWLDCRIDGVYKYHQDDICLQILPEHWEANWAAVPVNYFKIGVFWDEEFDKGIAYENIDFAKSAIAVSGRRVIMDTRNHAISLPHKDYFQGEREEITLYSNKNRYEEKWSGK